MTVGKETVKGRLVFFGGVEPNSEQDFCGGGGGDVMKFVAAEARTTGDEFGGKRWVALGEPGALGLEGGEGEGPVVVTVLLEGVCAIFGAGTVLEVEDELFGVFAEAGEEVAEIAEALVGAAVLFEEEVIVQLFGGLEAVRRAREPGEAAVAIGIGEGVEGGAVLVEEGAHHAEEDGRPVFHGDGVAVETVAGGFAIGGGDVFVGQGEGVPLSFEGAEVGFGEGPEGEGAVAERFFAFQEGRLVPVVE